MNKTFAKLMLGAAVTGLVGSTTMYAGTSTDKGKDAKTSTEKTKAHSCKGKDGCKGKDAKAKDSCKGHDTTKAHAKDKKEKHSCKGKDGCKS